MKNSSFDLNVRYLDFDGRKIEIDYISSLCSDELIAYLVEGITNAKGKTLKDCLNNGDVKEELNKENYEYAMLTGCAIVKDIDKSKVYVLIQDIFLHVQSKNQIQKNRLEEVKMDLMKIY